ncbi:hypothetical protein C8A03DRAFT_47519 [Achaetomium macrosporum]|uniref:Uncharacterized protein n=1 Tax=Achaetomium macrosporum TaxID=79813 RepID=A0AAN7H460_9PEZI|nr:hypothetical protein C8A03DRAFT_47519 [Achaetomium macrosporum]
MVLKRPEICELSGFTSWTAVQVWLTDVVDTVYKEFVGDYLKRFYNQGVRAPQGGEALKQQFVGFAADYENMVKRRVEEMENGVELPPISLLPNAQRRNIKRHWNLVQHYEHFIVEAVAKDRFHARHEPLDAERNHICTKYWAADPVELFGRMYELTEALVHNYWKPTTDEWDSDDSDVPYTDAADLPGSEQYRGADLQ